MFKSYHKLLLSAAVVFSAATSVAVAGDQTTSRTYENGKKVIDGGATYPVVKSKTSSYYVNEKAHKGGYKLGRTPTKNEEAHWDIDVMPDGTGLPEGSGTVEDGDEIYEAKCASCHFDFGAGGAGYPALSKGNAYKNLETLKHQRVMGAQVDPPARVFGSYWPQASTLWWYIKTGMPHPAPMSLETDEVYALVAYVLYINEMEIDGELVDDEYELDREKFLKIKMPNEDGFEPNIDGPNALEDVRAYFNDFSNYGNGTRCMKNCFNGEPVITRIQGAGISDYEPPLSTERSLPKKAGGGEVPGKKEYEASCAVCHATDAMGAPAVGDKKAWMAVMEKGIKAVHDNAINGVNGMPPKGGTSFSDEKMKEIVDYMIGASK